jgi:formylglycine-generating enzyme required for sulfatase activity
MATPAQLEVRKNGEDKACGIFTIEEVKKQLQKKELCDSDWVRDPSKPNSPWRQVRDISKPSNSPVSGSASELTSAATIDHISNTSSTALTPKQQPATQRPIPLAPASGEHSISSPPSAQQSPWTRNEKVFLMAIAFAALGLTLLNTGWLLFANASQVPPANAAPQASAPPPAESKPQKSAFIEDASAESTGSSPTGTSARSPATKSSDGPDRAKNAPPKKGSPANNAESAATATKPIAKASSPGDQGPADAGPGEAKLDQLVEKLDRLLKQFPPQEKPAILLDAVEKGEWRCQIGEVEFIFIYIPAGTFLFGYPSEDQDRVIRATGNPNAFLNASPLCPIRMSRGFFMLDREITNAQWEACLKPTKDGVDTAAVAKEATDPGKRSLPKRNVNWLEASEFCQAFQNTAEELAPGGCVVRLPTEIEWEYAARGGQGGLLPWVTDAKTPGSFYGNAQSGAGGPVATDPTKAKDCSWRRQFDFAGNLSEWCLDRYDQDLHESLVKAADGKGEVVYSPWADELVAKALATSQADPNPSRTFRGGSFADPTANCELPMRRFLFQNKGADQIGFRPVIVLKDSGSAAAQAK